MLSLQVQHLSCSVGDTTTITIPTSAVISIQIRYLGISDLGIINVVSKQKKQHRKADEQASKLHHTIGMKMPFLPCTSVRGASAETGLIGLRLSSVAHGSVKSQTTFLPYKYTASARQRTPCPVLHASTAVCVAAAAALSLAAMRNAASGRYQHGGTAAACR